MLDGEDTCVTKQQNECTGSCLYTEETGNCAKISGSDDSGSDTGEDSESESKGSGSDIIEDSESDSSGFLKLSIFICLFVIFL